MRDESATDLDDRKAAYEAAGTERTKAVRGAPRNLYGVPTKSGREYDATGLAKPTVAPAASAPTVDVTQTDAASFTSAVDEVPVAAPRTGKLPEEVGSMGGSPKPGRPTKKRAPVFLAEKAKSEDVLFLKDFLRDQGLFEGESTDYFDAATTEAVKAFQKQQGLKPDGLVGDKTLTALREVQMEMNEDAALRLAAPPTAGVRDPGLPSRVRARLSEDDEEISFKPGGLTVEGGTPHGIDKDDFNTKHFYGELDAQAGLEEAGVYGTGQEFEATREALRKELKRTPDEANTARRKMREETRDAYRRGRQEMTESRADAYERTREDMRRDIEAAQLRQKEADSRREQSILRDLLSYGTT